MSKIQGRLVSHTLKLVVVALTVVVVGASCGSSSSVVDENCGDGFSIAFIGPLTGTESNFATNVMKGAELSIIQHNESKDGSKINLLALDTEANPKKADSLADEIIANPCVIGVVGPVTSQEAAVVSPKLNTATVPLISPTATDAALVTNSWDVFHRVPVGSDQLGSAIAQRIIADGRVKVGIVDDGSLYGKNLADMVRGALGEKAIQLSSLNPEGSDYSATIALAKDAAVDAVFYGGLHNPGGKLMRQLSDAELMTGFYSGDLAKDLGFIAAAGPSAEGAIFACACAPSNINSEFLSLYTSRFDGDVPGVYSAEAYDAASVFIAGVNSGVSTAVDMLAFINKYDAAGMTKQLKWKTSGEIANSVVYFYEVLNGAIESIGSLKQ